MFKFNFFKVNLPKRRRLIADETDMMAALRAISEIKQNSKIHNLMSMEVGKCGWADEPNMWFIFYDASDVQWRKTIKLMKENNYKLVLREDDQLYLSKED